MPAIRIIDNHKNLTNIGILTHDTIDLYLDQSVKTDASPTFAEICTGVISATGDLVMNSTGDIYLIPTGANEITHAVGDLDVSGSFFAKGHAYFSQYLYHYGDTNTYIRFITDRIDLYAGGLRMLSAVEGTWDAVVVNENGSDVDFRVESMDSTSAFAVDARHNYIQHQSGLVHKTVHKTAAYTITIGDHTILCDGTFTLTISGDIGIDGITYWIKNTGTGAITIAPDRGLIEGAATHQLNAHEGVIITFSKNCQEWYIIAGY